jgi:hypothetical protein
MPLELSGGIFFMKTKIDDDDLSRPPIADPVAEIPAETGAPRTAVYDEIRKGHLRTFKIGRKRFATHEAVLEWIRKLEEQTSRGAA